MNMVVANGGFSPQSPLRADPPPLFLSVDVKRFHLHLVSDSTGETINAVAKAALAQFDEVDAVEHPYGLVRSPKQIERILAEIEHFGGVVMFTLVNHELRDQLVHGCGRLGVPCVPVLDPVVGTLASFLGAKAGSHPGRQHALDAEYFHRIDAMQFTMSHDDGQMQHDLGRADVILVGVSRTSKTPTCVYLANRGLKAANVPLVPNVALPPVFDDPDAPLIVGLTVNPDHLVQIRRNRLLTLRQQDDTDYVDVEAVREEVTAARKLFTRKNWPVIDVTRRSIEETAATIINLYARRNETLPPSGA
jgi:regulator of PEP synthase PpsR (kinase-PPPase family)